MGVCACRCAEGKAVKSGGRCSECTHPSGGVYVYFTAIRIYMHSNNLLVNVREGDYLKVAHVQEVEAVLSLASRG
eukprot:1160913-Pelagomonas_calceolata.AAC.3